MRRRLDVWTNIVEAHLPEAIANIWHSTRQHSASTLGGRKPASRRRIFFVLPYKCQEREIMANRVLRLVAGAYCFNAMLSDTRTWREKPYSFSQMSVGRQVFNSNTRGWQWKRNEAAKFGRRMTWHDRSDVILAACGRLVAIRGLPAVSNNWFSVHYVIRITFHLKVINVLRSTCVMTIGVASWLQRQAKD